MDKIKCWCGNYVNPETVMSAVAGTPTCTPNCHHVALEQIGCAEGVEDMGMRVTGAAYVQPVE